MRARRINVFSAELSSEPVIGRWLWGLEDARNRTFEELEGLSQQAIIDWQPPERGANSIGTILYHIAAIEADWLYVEALEKPFPTEVVELLPYPVRDEDGFLFRVENIEMSEHLTRLASVRRLLLAGFQQMSLADYRRVRSFEHYDVTPEWVLHHLMQHEAQHRGEIGSVRTRAQLALEP